MENSMTYFFELKDFDPVIIFANIPPLKFSEILKVI